MEASPVTTDTVRSVCSATCLPELIGFCNILPSAWPTKTPLCLGSAGQNLLQSSFVAPRWSKQQLPPTADPWASILCATPQLCRVRTKLEVAVCLTSGDTCSYIYVLLNATPWSSYVLDRIYLWHQSNKRGSGCAPGDLQYAAQCANTSLLWKSSRWEKNLSH